MHGAYSVCLCVWVIAGCAPAKGGDILHTGLIGVCGDSSTPQFLGTRVTAIKQHGINREPTAPVNCTVYRDTIMQVPAHGCSSLEPRWLGVSCGVELTQAHSQDVPRSIEVAVPIDVAVCAHLQAVTFPVSIRS